MLQLRDRFTSPASKSIAAMTELSKRGQKVRKDIIKMGDAIGKTGKTITAAMTVPIVGMAAASVKTAADFEASMSQVAATMGKSREEITDLTALAQRMGAATAFSASEAADGINILAMAGLDAIQISESLGTVLDLAAAGAMDMGSAASYVVGAVKGFNDEMGNASRYADLMAKGATLANTDVQALGEAVSYGAATAKGYSQSVDSMTLALLRMAEQNVTGQTAATSLNRAMADLYSPTKDAKAALDSLGISAYNADGSARDFNEVVDALAGALKTMSEEEANALKNTVFTTNGLNAFNKMTASSARRVQELWSGLGDSGGSAAQQAATQLDNLNGQITILKSAVEGAAIAFGNKMLPYVKKAAEYAQVLMDRVNGLSDAQVDLVMRIAGIAAAAGPAVVAFGALVSGVGKGLQMYAGFGMAVQKAGGILGLFTSPVGLVVGGIAALTGIVLVCIKNADKFRESLGEFSPLFHEVKSELQQLAAKMLPFISMAQKAGKVFWDVFQGLVVRAAARAVAAAGQIVKALIPVANGIMSVVGKADFRGLGEKVMSLAAHFQRTWAALQPVLKVIVDAVTFAFQVKWAVVLGAAAGFLGGFVSGAVQILDGLLTVLDGIIAFITGVFTGNWSQAWEGVKTVFAGVFESIEGLAKAVLNGVIGAVNGVVTSINGAGFTIPDWVPGVGGKAFRLDIPTIPALAAGTRSWTGGLAQVSERGGEIIDLPRGSRVYPHDESIRMARQEGASGAGGSITIAKLADQIIVREDADIERIADAIVRRLKKRSETRGGWTFSGNMA